MEMSLIPRIATNKFCGAFFSLIRLCILVQFSNGQVETVPSISSSVANYVCQQQSEFQESGTIQTPLKTRPENDDSKCGWLFWTKCTEGNSNSNSESCPSFELKPCGESEPGKTPKKGKGITTSKKQEKLPASPCDNSTETGLPDPQIVRSVSKYPSLVTIETGDGCQVKYSTGLILNQNWIIVHQTGGFWLYQPEHSDYYVVVAGQRKTYVEEGTEQRRSVAEYIPHPESKMDQRLFYKDNIGLARLSQPLELNENVQPIDLSAIEAIAPSIDKSSLTIVGWLKGQPKKSEDELLASLIESSLDFVPIDDCYDKDMEHDEAPRDTLFCAGNCIVQGERQNQPMKNILYAQQNSDPESGSPPVPVGLGPIRYGYNSQYGVFVNLASYIPWIKEAGQGQGQGQGQGPESDSRIIRGEDAPPYKYKSMVNLEVYSSYACTRHSCGATILNEEWILTAAHCIASEEPKGIRIIVGDYDISDNDENEQILTVSKIIVHENYTRVNALNDIGLLRVTPPIKFSDKVQKARLPEPSFEAIGRLMAIGWGLDENFIFPHILQEVDIPHVPLDQCQELYGDTDKIPTESQMCAGDETHGPCKADSGSPLYKIDESGEQLVLGIVSYHLDGPCKNWLKGFIDPDGRSAVGGGLLANSTVPFRPNVFTRVAYYIDWIMKNAELA